MRLSWLPPNLQLKLSHLKDQTSFNVKKPFWHSSKTCQPTNMTFLCLHFTHLSQQSCHLFKHLFTLSASNRSSVKKENKKFVKNLALLNFQSQFFFCLRLLMRAKRARQMKNNNIFIQFPSHLEHTKAVSARTAKKIIFAAAALSILVSVFHQISKEAVNWFLQKKKKSKSKRNFDLAQKNSLVRAPIGYARKNCGKFPEKYKTNANNPRIFLVTFCEVIEWS